jgi:hypothetical protein
MHRSTVDGAWFRVDGPRYVASMELSLLLIIIGIVLAILVNHALGIACILIGLVLLIWPRVSGGWRGRRT